MKLRTIQNALSETLVMVLMFPYLVDTLCMKQAEMTDITKEGYTTVSVETNACMEIISSAIKPSLSERGLGFVDFKRHYSDECCCAVQNWVDKQILLVSFDRDKPPEVVKYRRIESCQCVPCSEDRRRRRRR
ncbi:uncharacterized protein LOC106178667 [Lingula anatina]|uniref:Uncharacterized protein LOC106178667 n=1 Tax=Lingula anatina TaxID=7574 RepID=A0A1S3K4F2_LINAN|nr:uncharacterized protein LOC106178667 [Lingula anatina]|eukprot:XP_013417402.1 uncharacterized protein LOC106178667 [Lingula anatina]